MKHVRLASKGKFDARKGVCKVRTKAKIVLRGRNPIPMPSKAMAQETLAEMLALLRDVFPYVNGYVSTLGGEHNASVLLTVSLDSKERWINGILENSRYAKLHLATDGTLEKISGNQTPKLRKSKVKSAEHAARKIIEAFASRSENPRVRVHATPTEHEKNEWARMAQDAYAKGFNAIGHRFSAAAALPRGEKIPSARFDSLMADYRAWLIDGWKAFAEENPRGRSKRGITRVSQATGARPSKQLIERRKKTLKAPKGYFANPKLRKGQVFVVTNKAGDWLAEFGHRDDAVRWAKAYANRHGVQVRVVEA